jgi:hypothetical protein
MYIPHVLFFLTRDGRVPSVKVKGLEKDPSEFSTPFPGARNSIPKGSISGPFSYYYVKKGADFSLFSFPFLSAVSMVHNKRWQKRKEDFKEKIRTVLFRNPKAQLTGCMGPPGFRKVLGLGRVHKIQSLSSNSLLTPLK